MRKIRNIIVHCSAGNQKAKAKDIVHYHTAPTYAGGCGWSVPGYHYFIEADGNVVELVPIDRISNGCKGYNLSAVNVCYAGGVELPSYRPIDNRTPQQKTALRALLVELRCKFPNAEIHSHRDFANKACPSFDATSEYADI